MADAARHAGERLDDAYISLRYARNLVEGHGLVFNPGERVEGYTNLLFVLAAALFLEIGIDPLPGTAAISFGAALWCLHLVSGLERGAGAAESSRPRFPIAAVLLLTTGAFAYWAVVSLETMLFTALLTWSVLLLAREGAAGRGRGSALAFLLLTLARPEGALCFAAGTAAAAGAERIRTGSWRHLRRVAENAALYAAGAGAFLTWRVAYYGDYLPNTFHAKVTGGEGQIATGLAYLRDWALAAPLAAAALLSPVLLAFRPLRGRLTDGGSLAAAWASAAALALYAAAVGGDSMPFFRFFVPLLPLACVLCAASWRLLAGLGTGGRRRAFGAAAGLLFILHVVAAHATEQPYRAFVAHRTAVVGSAVGRWLASILDPRDLVATNTVGALPYDSRLPTLDMLGLTDAVIARRPVYVASAGWAGHRRGWGAYVLDRRPRAILWYNSAGSAEPHYLSDRELADDPYFRFFYRLRVAELPAASGPEAARRVIARFLGFPFGFDRTGAAVSGELGVAARFHEGLLPRTTFTEAPIVVRYFEPDPRDAPLWGLREEHAGDVEGFVSAVAARWGEAEREAPPPDAEARSEVEALCAEALVRYQSGEVEAAKGILAEAVRRNDAARSPLVYQYLANVAVETRDLLAAVPAQKEALRLAPGSALYASNLMRLLTVPFERFRARSGRPSG